MRAASLLVCIVSVCLLSPFSEASYRPLKGSVILTESRYSTDNAASFKPYTQGTRIKMPLVVGNAFAWTQGFTTSDRIVEARVELEVSPAEAAMDNTIGATHKWARIYDVEKRPGFFAYTIRVKMKRKWKGKWWLGSRITFDEKTKVGFQRFKITFGNGAYRSFWLDIVRP